MDRLRTLKYYACTQLQDNELLLECTHFSYMIDNKICLNEEITQSNKDYINYILSMGRTS